MRIVAFERQGRSGQVTEGRWERFTWLGERGLAAAVALLSLLIPGAAGAADAPPSAAGSYAEFVQYHLKVPMDDGVVLDATVGYPADSSGKPVVGRFPVIVQQSPYAQPVVNGYFVRHGYIFLNVAPRGTEASEGQFDYWGPRSTRDGKEIVDWVVHRLPGSNGVIGLYGCSYSGINGIATAEAVDPHSGVKALVTECPVADVFRDFMPAGIPTELIPFLTAMATMTGKQPSASTFMGYLIGNILAGEPQAYASGEFAAERDFTTKADRIVRNGIPTLIWEGWDSQGPRTDLEFYAALQNAHHHRPWYAPMDADAEVSWQDQVIIGPWPHGGGLDDALNLQWFDTFLKGAKAGVHPTRTPMHLYERGSNRWISAATYPLVKRYTPFYLGSGGLLSTAKPGGSGHDAIVWGPPTQRRGSLTFQTAPFQKGATLAGPISATLFASSSNTNAELILTLYDVAPNGSAVKFTLGTVLGSLSDLDESKSWRDENGTYIRPYTLLSGDHYLRPHAINRFVFELMPEVQAILPGHSLRLTVTTTFQNCKPGIGRDPCNLTAVQKRTVPGGIYALQRSSSYPSAVNLPLLPYRYFPTARSAATPTSHGSVEPLDWGE